MQRSALCRSRRQLSNAYLLAKFQFDTAENEPLPDRAVQPAIQTVRRGGPSRRRCGPGPAPARRGGGPPSGRACFGSRNGRGEISQDTPTELEIRSQGCSLGTLSHFFKLNPRDSAEMYNLLLPEILRTEICRSA